MSTDLTVAASLPSDSQIKNLTSTVRGMMYQEVVSQVKQIVTTLPAIDLVRKTVPAAIFVNYFLPFFKGQKTNHSADTLMKYWMSIADGPFNEVDVIAPSGEIIATVPRIYNNRAVSPVSMDSSVNISKVIFSSLRDPLMQTAPLMRILQSLGEAMPTDGAQYKVDTAAWEKLFNAFETEKPTQHSSTAPIETKTDDDFTLDF